MGNFPFVSIADTEKRTELPVFSEIAYDFERNCFRYRNGQNYLVYKDEALKIWIFKALKTARFRYAAYTHNYGNELEELIGCVEDKEIQQSEVRRYIIEALMVNPYIQEVKDFTCTFTGSGMTVIFSVISLYGRFTWEEELYNE